MNSDERANEIRAAIGRWCPSDVRGLMEEATTDERAAVVLSDVAGQSLLSYATYALASLTCMEILLEFGADPDGIEPERAGNIGPLYWALKSPNPFDKMILLLRNGANPAGGILAHATGSRRFVSEWCRWAAANLKGDSALPDLRKKFYALEFIIRDETWWNAFLACGKHAQHFDHIRKNRHLPPGILALITLSFAK